MNKQRSMNYRATRNILIADSGATKTDWCLTRNGEILQRVSGKGISPVYQAEEEIEEVIRLQVCPQLKNWEIHSIYFYGSGCIPGKSVLVERALHKSFSIGTIQVYSDLMAAAHSLCGHDAGIACIMGTGSNSCEWSGSKIVAQVSPLGFILGDEGSGAALGRQLLGDAMKNQLSPGLRQKLLKEYNLTPTLIIEKVYRQPFPSRFLASFAPFLLSNIEDESIRRIVNRSFTDFFERNVMQYDYRKQKVHFVGSIAWYFADLLREVAATKEIMIGKIAQSPMPGLIEFHK